MTRWFKYIVISQPFIHSLLNHSLTQIAIEYLLSEKHSYFSLYILKNIFTKYVKLFFIILSFKIYAQFNIHAYCGL